MSIPIKLTTISSTPLSLLPAVTVQFLMLNLKLVFSFKSTLYLIPCHNCFLSGLGLNSQGKKWYHADRCPLSVTILLARNLPMPIHQLPLREKDANENNSNLLLPSQRKPVTSEQAWLLDDQSTINIPFTFTFLLK